ncbi:MAG TPA: RNA polymerase sigma factor [Balneolales bacterium]|nr:RNA polymerase sigma factor [Balneolales bacterium]
MMDNKHSQHIDRNRLSLLWQRLCQGDEEALAELFKQQYIRLYNYGRKLINDDEIVEDAIQDVFATIWRTRERLKPAASITTYLIISLRRRLIRLKGKEHKEINLETYHTEAQPDIRFSALDIMIASENDLEQRRIIADAINMLPVQKREVIYLHFVNGMDYEEISQIMGLKGHTVRNYMSEALIRLKIIILNRAPHLKMLLLLAILLASTQ